MLSSWRGTQRGTEKNLPEDEIALQRDETWVAWRSTAQVCTRGTHDRAAQRLQARRSTIAAPAIQEQKEMR